MVFIQYSSVFSQLSDPSISRNRGAPIYISSNSEPPKEKLTNFISSGDAVLVTDSTYPFPIVLTMNFE